MRYHPSFGLTLSGEPWRYRVLRWIRKGSNEPTAETVLTRDTQAEAMAEAERLSAVVPEDLGGLLWYSVQAYDPNYSLKDHPSPVDRRRPIVNGEVAFLAGVHSSTRISVKPATVHSLYPAGADQQNQFSGNTTFTPDG
jgi:hypothetical protein